MSEPMNRDEQVYTELWRHRDGEEVCIPIPELALLTGLSTDQVRAALADLCRTGWLSATGRRQGKTAVFAFLHSDSRGRSGQGGSPDPKTEGTSDLGSGADHTETATDEPQAATSPVATADKVVTNLERWVSTAGLHFDREAEVVEEVFGRTEEHGGSWGGLIRRMTGRQGQEQLRAGLLSDQELKARLLELWRRERKKGEQVERDVTARASQWRKSRAKLQALTAALPQPTLKPMPELSIAELPGNATRTSNGNETATGPPHRTSGPTTRPTGTSPTSDESDRRTTV